MQFCHYCPSHMQVVDARAHDAVLAKEQLNTNEC